MPQKVTLAMDSSSSCLYLLWQVLHSDFKHKVISSQGWVVLDYRALTKVQSMALIAIDAVAAVRGALNLANTRLRNHHGFQGLDEGLKPPTQDWN